MAENRSEFVLGLGADDSAIRAIFASFKRTITEGAAELERTTSNIVLFRGLTENLDKARAAVDEATGKLQTLQTEIQAVQAIGGQVGAGLTKGLLDAQKAVTSATKEFDKQQATVDKLGKSLQAAGVNTSNLAAEEQRLAAAIKAAQAAQADQAAARTLGIKLASQEAAEVQKAVQAFNTLRASGRASAADIAAAQGALNTRLKETTSNAKAGGAAIDKFGASVRSIAAGAIAPFLGITAAITGVISAYQEAIARAKEWNNTLAQGNTVVNASTAEMKDLSDGVRELARRLGFDAVEGAKALFEIIRGGVPKENALEVLAASAEFAKASFTDIGTAAKLSGVLISGFGVTVGELRGQLDVLIQAQHNGGATAAELAAGLGDIAPQAVAANVPLREVVASVQTLVQLGLDAPGAIAQTGKIIAKLGDPEVARHLHDIGIEVDGLVGTLVQIGQKGLSLDKVLGLGLGSTKGAAAIAGLTTNFAALQKNLDETTTAAGATTDALQKFANTDAAKTERLAAAADDLSRSIGLDLKANIASSTSSLTTFLNFLNDTRESARRLQAELGKTGGTGFVNVYLNQLKALAIELGLTTDAQVAFNFAVQDANKAAVAAATTLGNSIGAALAAVQAQAAKATAVVNQTTNALKNFADDLAKQRDASQKATAQAIADIGTRAAAELAAVSSIQQGEIAAAKDTLAIQTKAAADKLAVIVKGTADVLSALASEAAARRAIAGKSAIEQARVEQDLTQQRIAALAPIRAALEQHYQEQVARARAAQDAIARIDLERVSLNDSIEAQIREIHRQTLPAYQAYNDKLLEIDELTSRARAELAKGDKANLQTVDELANRVRSLSGQVSQAVVVDGATIVNATQAQTNATQGLRTAQDLLNESLSRRKAAFKADAEAADQNAEDTLDALKPIREELKQLQETAAKGISVAINTDEGEISSAFAKLQTALDEKKLLAEVELDLKDAQSAINTLTADLKKGITDTTKELTDTIAADVQAAAEKAPQLKIKTDEVTAQIDEVKAQVEGLGLLKLVPTLEVKSNVEDVQAEIDNLKKPTSSTHTVTIKTVNEQGQPVAPPEPAPGAGFAEGGPVGAPASSPGRSFRLRGFTRRARAPARFARGGPVFARPAWAKVPGQGLGDTVPAALRAGSYVVRRSASRYYGDGLMARVARFAGGGTVSKDEVRRYALEQFGFDPFGGGGNAQGGGFPSGPGGGGFPERGGGAGGFPERGGGAGGFPTSGGGAGAAPGAAPGKPGEKPKPREPGQPLKPGESIQPTDPPVSFDTRPIPDELITAANVMAYAREMLNMVGPTNPLLGALLPAITSGLTAVESNPTNKTALTELLRAAETIGANPYIFAMWGKTTGAQGRIVPTWFVDWLAARGLLDAAGNITSASQTKSTAPDYAKGLLDSGFAQAGPPAVAQRILGAQASDRFKRFFGAHALAVGGPAGRDSVAALLTPGEWVVNVPAVRKLTERFGPGFLPAVNRGEVPRAMLSRIMAPPAPVSRFAAGGMVSGSPGASSGSSGPQGGIGGGGGDVTVNVNAPAGMIFSEANVRRWIVPVLRDIERKGR